MELTCTPLKALRLKKKNPLLNAQLFFAIKSKNKRPPLYCIKTHMSTNSGSDAHVVHMYVFNVTDTVHRLRTESLEFTEFRKVISESFPCEKFFVC